MKEISFTILTEYQKSLPLNATEWELRAPRRGPFYYEGNIACDIDGILKNSTSN